MANKRQCVDSYGERLKIGDEVIPVFEEAAIIGIGGIITGIEYSEKYDNHFITISDKEGKVLLKNVDSRCYTTRERFHEREYSNYVYSLTFYNDKLYVTTTLPLTGKTDPDYEIPDNTRLVVLDCKYLTYKKNNIQSFSGKTIYSYFVEKDIKLYCDPKNEEYDYDFYYVMNDEHNWHQISGRYRILDSEEELQACVKDIIKYFKGEDLTHVNNDVLYKDNPELKNFERRLVRKLNNK